MIDFGYISDGQGGQRLDTGLAVQLATELYGARKPHGEKVGSGEFALSEDGMDVYHVPTRGLPAGKLQGPTAPDEFLRRLAINALIPEGETELPMEPAKDAILPNPEVLGEIAKQLGNLVWRNGA